MPTYATPGVYFENADEANAAVSALRTDVAAFVGIAAQGPVHQAMAVTSWNQFQSAFGSFIPNGYLAYCAKAFFENGGEKLYAVRVAAPLVTTGTNPIIAQPADGSSSLVQSVEGFVPGALVTVSQNALTSTTGAQPPDGRSSIVQSVAGFPQGVCVLVSQGAPLQQWRKVTAVDPVAKRLYWDSLLTPPFNLGTPLQLESSQQMDYVLLAVDGGSNTLIWTSPLTPAFDISQPMQFVSGAGAALGIFYDGGGNPTLQVCAASPGTWGDSVAVGLAPSSLAATATSSQTQPVSGAYSYVDSITGFPTWSLVKVFQSGNVGYRVVTLADASTGALTWDSPLVAPFILNDPTQPISFETVEFSLTVYVGGRPQEIFTGLSLMPKHSRYVECVINPRSSSSVAANKSKTGLPSQYIRVTDLKSPSGPPNNLPNPASPQLTGGVLNLRGGRDGLAALQPDDFTGDPGSSRKWGLRLLEDVDEVSIVAVPDILIEPAPLTSYAPVTPPARNPCLPGPSLPAMAPPPPPQEATPAFSLDEVALVQQALVAHCEAMQFRFAILDPPDFGYPNQEVGLAEIQSWRNRFDTEFAALYFPWVLVVDPPQSGNGVVRRIPPSGHVAGVYASTDLTVGVFKAPANAILQWAQDLTTEVTPEMQGFLNPIGVDCLRAFSGRGLRVYGARTVSSDTSWQFVNVRRLVSMVEHALLIALQWAVFEPNNYSLWSTVTASVTNFLTALWKQGAFVGNTPADAFYVTCNATNNPVTLTEAGQLNVEIGVAPTLPAEFVVFRIGVTQDTLGVTE